MAKARVSRGTSAPKARKEQPVSEGIRRAAKRAGITVAEAAQPARAVIELSALTELIDFLDSIPDYLVTVWDKLEELSNEANAGYWLFANGNTVPTRADVDEPFEEIEAHRRPAVKNIRYALANVRFVQEQLSLAARGAS